MQTKNELYLFFLLADLNCVCPIGDFTKGMIIWKLISYDHT